VSNVHYTREIKVGVALVVATIIFFMGVRLFQGLPTFAGTYEIEVVFDDAGGLIGGNPVFASGVRIGTVRRVDLDRATHRVLVQAQIDRDVPIPEGTVAAVSGMGPLGGQRLDLTLGPPGSPALPPGSRIPGREDRLFEGTVERIPHIMDRLEVILMDAEATMGAVRGMVTDSQGDLRTTLASFRSSARQLEQVIRSEQERARTVLAGAERATAGVEGVTADVRRFTTTHMDTLAIAVERANRLMARLDASTAALDGSLVRADSILARVERGEGTLGKLVQDERLFERADSALTQINDILEELQSDPGRYLRHLRLFSLY
jgi:phospholipid/cholesterol/gamma-HCH transport system substrate-binding protein